jgi:hypothetical protein
MAKRERESESKSLSKLGDASSWRGDEHELRLAAAREAGMEAEEIADVELELFTEGFKAGMVLDEPSDRSIVLRGRTILGEKQMSKALTPTLRFLSIPKDQVALRIHDGEFELRVARTVAEAAKPTLDAAKVTLKLWLGAGLIGLLAWNMFELGWLAAIVWGVALVLGGYVLRQGTVSGRSMLAARLTVALALLAKEEQLILPPARIEDR